MVITSSRWFQAWCFLSLDRIRSHAKDLWLAGVIDQDLQAGLRQGLGPSFSDAGVYENAGYYHSLVGNWLLESGRATSLEYLVGWVQDVFLLGGQDRQSEMAWMSLTYHLARRQGELSPAVRNSIVEVNQLLGANQDRVDSQLRASATTEVSAWDRLVLARLDTTTEDVDRQVSLIAGYNSCLSLWFSKAGVLTMAERKELHTAALVVGREIGWHESDIPFPLSWQFELDSMIRRNSVG